LGYDHWLFLVHRALLLPFLINIPKDYIFQ